MSELMLEFESTFSFHFISFAKVESVTSEFSLALTIKYESKPYAVRLLNVMFLLARRDFEVFLPKISFSEN